MYFVIIFLVITFGLDLLAFWISNFSMKYRIQKYKLVKEKTKQIVKFIMQKNEILHQDKSTVETNNILKIIDQYWYFGYKRRQLEHRSFNAPEIWIAVIKIFALYFAGNQIINNQLWYDTYLWIILLVSLLGTVTQNAINTLKTIIKEWHNIWQFWEFFDTTKQIQWYDSWYIFDYKSWNIKLDNVSFTYWDNKKLFNNFSLNILWSSKTAFVWPSGGGKSTLIKLIAWYIRLDSGNIYIDDQNLSQVSLKSYYSHIWYLIQEPSVFDGTIRENLLYWVSSDKNSKSSELLDSQINNKSENIANIYINQKDNLTLQDSVSSLDIFDSSVNINQVIKLSRCEWIYDLPNWLDTEIWEKGIRLSWWQRQRLAIAKIMIKNPDIILLDEPTSALDSENKELVTQALNNLFVGKTVIIIAHRLQTVKHSDQIIYINDWQVM